MNKEELREYKRNQMRDWRIKNPEKAKAIRKRCYENTKEKFKLRNQKWKEGHPDYMKKYNEKYLLETKMLVLIHYGGNPPKCACCGETIIQFLTIDHPNGGGCKQRKELGLRSGQNFYRWLIKNNYPEGYQVLCWNCNCGKDKSGLCPHKREK